MTTSTTHVHDENQIRHLLTAWTNAVMGKDLDGIVADYAAEIVLYDAIPPYKTIGRPAVRQAWANCLPFFPKIFQLELRDLVIQVSGDLGMAHYLCHFAPTPADDPCGQTWMRVTEGFRLTAGAWQVIHSHISVPFNPMNNQAWFIKNPDVVDAPDYGQACS